MYIFDSFLYVDHLNLFIILTLFMNINLSLRINAPSADPYPIPGEPPAPATYPVSRVPLLLPHSLITTCLFFVLNRF